MRSPLAVSFTSETQPRIAGQAAFVCYKGAAMRILIEFGKYLYWLIGALLISSIFETRDMTPTGRFIITLLLGVAFFISGIMLHKRGQRK
jgi:hypothetical protein